MKHLYFIRHGESTGNLDMIFTGRLDLPLTKLGRQQAKSAASDAKNLNLDCIVSSSLVRALETAEIIAQDLEYPQNKIIVSQLFQERSYGDFQGKPYRVAEGIDFDTVRHAETSSQLVARAKEALEFLNNLDANSILISSHGTFGRALHQQLKHTDEQIEVPIEQELPNAQIIRWI